MEIENKLRELLVPVLGVESVAEISSGQALVNDLGADSIDFVEIIYLIEKNFGVILKTNEIILAGANPEAIFMNGKLTKQGAELIGANLPESIGRYQEGMTKMDLFSALTVRDLAHIIQVKKSAGHENQPC
jgi:acyl carrier protein